MIELEGDKPAHKSASSSQQTRAARRLGCTGVCTRAGPQTLPGPSCGFCAASGEGRSVVGQTTPFEDELALGFGPFGVEIRQTAAALLPLDAACRLDYASRIQ